MDHESSALAAEGFLAATERDLATAEVELAAARRSVERLTSRVVQQRELVEAARRGYELAVGSPSPAGPPPTAEPPPSPDIPSPFRPPTHTVDRVVRVLESAGRPLKVEQVRQQMAEHGWMDDDWSKPGAAIYAALRRAEQRGWVARVDSRRWIGTGRAAEVRSRADPLEGD